MRLKHVQATLSMVLFETGGQHNFSRKGGSMIEDICLPSRQCV